MGFLNFFKSKKTALPKPKTKVSDLNNRETWQTLPGMVSADPKTYRLVSEIAAAIAAGNQSDSQFVVQRILTRQSEAKCVALIATCLAAGTQPQSQFVVRKIMKKVSK